jgi:hypothetical protein
MKTAMTTAIAGVMVVSGLFLAAPAVADGQDLVPVASGNDNSLNTGYRDSTTAPTHIGIAGAPADELPPTYPGANPYVPLGPGR